MYELYFTNFKWFSSSSSTYFNKEKGIETQAFSTASDTWKQSIFKLQQCSPQLKGIQRNYSLLMSIYSRVINYSPINVIQHKTDGKSNHGTNGKTGRRHAQDTYVRGDTMDHCKMDHVPRHYSVILCQL